jgi:hypothetical protein
MYGYKRNHSAVLYDRRVTTDLIFRHTHTHRLLLLPPAHRLLLPPPYRPPYRPASFGGATPLDKLIR